MMLYCPCCYCHDFSVLGSYKPGYFVMYKCNVCAYIEFDAEDKLEKDGWEII